MRQYCFYFRVYFNQNTTAEFPPAALRKYLERLKTDAGKHLSANIYSLLSEAYASPQYGIWQILSL